MCAEYFVTSNLTVEAVLEIRLSALISDVDFFFLCFEEPKMNLIPIWKYFMFNVAYAQAAPI